MPWQRFHFRNEFRTNCLDSRPFNLPNCVCQFSFQFPRQYLLGSACECCYVCVGWSDRGGPAATTTSREKLETQTNAGVLPSVLPPTFANSKDGAAHLI